MFSSINNKNKLSLSSLDEEELNLVTLIQRELSESLTYISLSVVTPEIYGLREIERYLHDTIEVYINIKKPLRMSLRIDQTTSRGEFLVQLRKIRFAIEQYDENSKLESDRDLKINGAFLDKVLPKQKEENKKVTVAIKEKSFFNLKEKQGLKNYRNYIQQEVSIDHEKNRISFFEKAPCKQLYNQSLKVAKTLTEESFRETTCGKYEFSKIITDVSNGERWTLAAKRKYRPSTLPEIFNKLLLFGTACLLNFPLANTLFKAVLEDMQHSHNDTNPVVIGLFYTIVCILYITFAIFVTTLLTIPILDVLFSLTKKPGDLAWKMVTRRDDVAPGSDRTYKEVKTMHNPLYKLAVWFFTLRVKNDIKKSLKNGEKKYITIEQQKRKEIEAGTFI